ncbi:hypothetical protein DSO57_1038313 [Entomophthora muscae]|uniref:Uncharacterized protein n=1 Tax=Entomophthora muscae TaxID=34485 RepID=A0ACC2SZ06_9FUNG|nr:hypothetical protein DSO57_1038313 [Entomophthora muscae]
MMPGRRKFCVSLVPLGNSMREFNVAVSKSRVSWNISPSKPTLQQRSLPSSRSSRI